MSDISIVISVLKAISSVENRYSFEFIQKMKAKGAYEDLIQEEIKSEKETHDSDDNETDLSISPAVVEPVKVKLGRPRKVVSAMTKALKERQE